MNGALATGLYDAATALLFVHAVAPLPPLLWAVDRLNRAGDAFQAAQLRADQTRRNR